MSVVRNQDSSERIERDGERTRVEESRTVVADRGDPALRADYVDREVVDRRSVRTSSFSAATVNGILGILLLAVEALIATRFMLIAFGANRSSGFVDFILNISWPFVRPFSNVFSTRTWDQGIIEPASLLAMGVYAVVAVLAMLLINAIMPDIREHRDVASRETTRY